jgi:SAM-dependent methyltransferase
MDADLSHTPDLVPDLWAARSDAELIIASRYVGGGSASMPGYRHILSIILNVVYTRLLSLPVKDISSGFRLYQASVLRGLKLQSTDFDALEEILIQIYARGFKITEIPFRYVPRDEGKSKVKLLRFGMAYLRTLWRMWKLRNSVASADYDARAYDSWIPLQRYWQRRRFRNITSMVDLTLPCLDVGCGSSRILGALHKDSIGLDIQMGKLLYSRRYGRPLVRASAMALPFRSGCFSQVLSSQMIEHIPAGDEPFAEIGRVTITAARLVIGTPDYGTLTWRILEGLYRWFAPGGYADEHITHYTRASLSRTLRRAGFAPEQVSYVGGAELVIRAKRIGDIPAESEAVS